jgi:hypothetical protein
MAKYKAPNEVVGEQRFDTDPETGKAGLTVGATTHPGYYIQYTYADGTTELRFFYQGDTPSDQHPGVLVKPGINVAQRKDWLDDQEGKTPPAQTPEQTRRAQQEVEAADRKAAEDARLDLERQYNASHPDEQGRAFSETHAERAQRELREQADARAEEARQQAARTERRQTEVAAQQAETARGNLEVSRGQLTLAQEREQREANKPEFLSQFNENNPYAIRYNPETHQVESMANPNFDFVKQESERLRSLLAVQIQARQVNLEEAKQQYQQWYDTNVKIPMAQAQEARDRAAEQRAALDAEERRRQFAANFSLQKGELGQRAGAAAMQAEESLLPYRAGPTESAEMSSAINSLAAGGTLAGPRADAGIHFTPEAFQFNAPDFKGIAKRAAADALKGISSYKPSGEGYSTGDYSSVPAIGSGGTAPTIPSGYGDFQGIIDQLKSTYNFGEPKG